MAANYCGTCTHHYIALLCMSDNIDWWQIICLKKTVTNLTQRWYIYYIDTQTLSEWENWWAKIVFMTNAPWWLRIRCLHVVIAFARVNRGRLLPKNIQTMSFNLKLGEVSFLILCSNSLSSLTNLRPNQCRTWQFYSLAANISIRCLD